MRTHGIAHALVGLIGLLGLGGGSTLGATAAAVQGGYNPGLQHPAAPQPACTGSVSFQPVPGSPFAVGARPQGMTAADFNGDGRPDLATANFNSTNVTVLLGNSTGSFLPAPDSPISLSTFPNSVAVGDFNGDGRLDLVTANYGVNLSGDAIWVLLGDGTGRFRVAPGSPFALSNRPFNMTVRDFNGDGRPDVVSSNYSSNTVTVLLGDGRGGFGVAPGSPILVGFQPGSVAVSDFNGDSRPDLAVTNAGSNNVTVLLGDGQGNFQPAAGSPIALGTFPSDVTAADFNGDGRADLAITNGGAMNMMVLLGDGTGSFRPAPGSPLHLSSRPGSTTAADFNGDGRLDLATTNYDTHTMTVLLGDGQGGFGVAPGSTFPAGTNPLTATVVDVNSDGRPDLATINFSSDTVTVLLNTCAAATATPPPTLTPADTCSLPFTDVPSAYYAAAAIQWAYCRGIINGYSDGTFRPEAATTRGQVAKLIALAVGWDLTPGPGAPHFGDVAPNSPFYAYVEAGYTHGVVGGYSDGTYRPAVPVTRAQLTKLLVGAHSYALITPPAPTFSDVPPTSWAYAYIETAVRYAVVGGYTDHTFRPNTNATRAQFCKLLYQAYARP